MGTKIECEWSDKNKISAKMLKEKIHFGWATINVWGLLYARTKNVGHKSGSGVKIQSA